MDKTSRTYKSLRNTVVALVYYAVNLVVVFLSRQIFMTHLGPEVLGLNTTASSLLQFINLAELGIGIAIGVTLYKPLAGGRDGQLFRHPGLVLPQGSMGRDSSILRADVLLPCDFREGQSPFMVRIRLIQRDAVQLDDQLFCHL